MLIYVCSRIEGSEKIHKKYNDTFFSFYCKKYSLQYKQKIIFLYFFVLDKFVTTRLCLQS